MKNRTDQLENSGAQNISLIDNWQLELAGRILAASDSSSVLPPGEQAIFERYPQEWLTSLRHGVDALLQVIDLIILYDVLIHGNSMSSAWDHLPHLIPLKKVLQPIPLQNAAIECLDKSKYELIKLYGPLVGEGALQYLTTAQQLGVSYWPSPARAKFLIKLSTQHTQSGFVFKLTETIDSTIKEIVTEILVALNKQPPPIFPGFGTAVLQNCNTSASIIQVALEFRASKEAIAFRNWISEMDAYLASGNIIELNKGLRELDDITADIKRSLGISTTDDDNMNVKLQIGLSPSLSFNQDAIETFLKWLRPKRLHLSFLRHHFDRALKCVDLSKQVDRLFQVKWISQRGYSKV
jgi:hypothetical protein